MQPYFIIFIRIVIVVLYGMTYNKYKKAQRMDSDMKMKFDFRSLLELALVTGINVGLIVMPINENTNNILLIGGQIMIVVTYLHLRRIVVFGKKVVYFLENPFLISDMKSFKYNKGKMTFLIKGTPLSIRFPLSDMNYVHERLSGKYYKK